MTDNPWAEIDKAKKQETDLKRMLDGSSFNLIETNGIVWRAQSRRRDRTVIEGKTPGALLKELNKFLLKHPIKKKTRGGR